MREVGMIFTAESVRAIMAGAIMAGAKTMTRRVILPQPDNPETFGVSPIWGYGVPIMVDHKAIPPEKRRFCLHAAFNVEGKRVDRWLPLRCGPSDRIYVKETWKPFALGTHGQTPAIYRADYELSDGPGGWRSSRFMPQWAARIWLPVTAVRAEQLQEISEEDAIAEGVDRHNHSAKWPDGDPGYIHDVARRNYSALWNRLHSRDGHGWGANPWVAVYQWEPWRKA